MERDYIGYGKSRPTIKWPRGGRLAINFVLNYEEGAEQSIPDGDPVSESYLTDLPHIGEDGERNLSVESVFEYGSRAGIWRLFDLFAEYEVPLTFFGTALALERNPDVATYLKSSTHDVAGHGFRWIDYRLVDAETERSHIFKAIKVLERLTQKKVRGWYTGRRSCNTRRFLIDAGIEYDSDSYADDLPYWVEVHNKAHLIIPYALETNDARFTMSPGLGNGEGFFHQLKGTFDCLYREGAKDPKMMTIGLHSRLSGRPGRCEALRRFISHVKHYDDVWICRREEILTHWQQHYPFEKR
jgi:allantoinase